MRALDLFDRGARLHPGRDVLHDGTAGYSYAQAAEISHRVANGLLAAGLRPRAHVSVYSPNDVRAFLCVLGLLRLGGVWVSLNARNAIDDNIYTLQLADVEFLFYHSDFEPHLERIRRDCPKIRQFVCIDREGPGVPALEDWLRPHAAPAPDPGTGPDDLAWLISSGGTTGRSKAVMLSNRSVVAMAVNYLSSMRFDEPPVHLVVAPMTHAAGCISFPLMAAGATNVVMRKADPLEIMENIQRFRVSTLFLPPTVIYMMLAHPRVREFDYSSLKYFVYAAAPMSADKLKQAVEVFGPVMAQTYGQAEAPMICTFLSPREHLVVGTPHEGRLASCGRECLLTEVAVMDDAGNLLPPGQAGEIVCRGDLVMQGYYKNPEATAEVSAHGWHHTGDIGLKDQDGYLYIVDRKKDMIITGGFNVYPSEVERVIWRHPAVQDCAVIGVPDEKWGEAVKAIVELKPGLTATEAELIGLCKQQLGGVKAPKTVEFWDTLPRSAVGKVLKRDLRERFWQGRSRRV